MAPLAERLERFALALLDTDHGIPEDLIGPDGQPSEQRFAVYRNNRFVGLIDALRAGFPRVEALVGDEFFAAMARVFATMHPPDSPVLLHYGAEFPDFIASFAPAESLPYLADVARIERATTEAYHEREAVAMALSDLAGVPPEQAAMLRFRLHPSVRLVRSSFPACTIWRMNAPDGTPAPVDLAEAQDIMVLRPEAEVEVRQVSAASLDFVDAIARGLTLSEAMEIALVSDGEFDLSDHLRALFDMGALVGVERGVEETAHE